MALIEQILGRPALRQALWRWWYPFFTRRVRAHGIDFLNYAFETVPPLGLVLAAADEPSRPNIQLYHHVAAASLFKGAKVLEVSCGHGGGAAYLARTFQPSEYIGLDLNPEGIRYCTARHQVPGLRFVTGDALTLPFPDGSFDVVVNVEASHCYPDFPRFLAEAARVLKPGGCLVHADLRYTSQLDAWLEALFHQPALRVQSMRLINPEVVRGMALNTPRYTAMIKECFPRFLHGLGLDFAGVKGSRLYRDAQSGAMSYRSFILRKVA